MNIKSMIREIKNILNSLGRSNLVPLRDEKELDMSGLR